MKKMMKKTTTWLMILCMVIGFIPAFASAAAARADEPAPAAVSAAQQSETDPEEPGPEDMFGMLWKALEAIGLNIQSLSVNDLLKYPANIMDDLLTYLFAVFKLFGVNLDALFARITSFL